MMAFITSRNCKFFLVVRVMKIESLSCWEDSVFDCQGWREGLQARNVQLETRRGAAQMSIMLRLGKPAQVRVHYPEITHHQGKRPTHPSSSKMQYGWLKASHRIATPSSPRSFQSRVRLFSDLPKVSTEARSSQQSEVRSHMSSLQQRNTQRDHHSFGWPGRHTIMRCQFHASKQET